MKVRVCFNEKLDLSESCLGEKYKNDAIVKVSGVGVFDENGKILPLISEFLSYQTKHEKIAYKSASTYGLNLTYFLGYLRERREYNLDETDEVFLTIPEYVIQEYMTHLEQKEGKTSSTVRNRDASIRILMDYLCAPNEDRDALREHNPYANGYLSKSPKANPVISCDLDDLAVLIECTSLERERTVLQFLYDSGVRRSELPRMTLEDFQSVLKFNSEKFIAKDSDIPIHVNYSPIQIKGSKGRGNRIKPRWTLVSTGTLKRVRKYHASPVYKKYARKYGSAAETPAFFNAEGTAYTPSAINKLLERVSNRGIKRGRLDRVISPHKLRHGNAYAILQSDDLGQDFLDRLVTVQKSLGHNQISTTEKYTSIPSDIYNTLCDENGELLTRAEKMKRLVEQTQLRIGIRDKK